MIYHNFNFDDSFSNAVGNRRNSMVLGELGKIINEYPQEIVVAIEDADIVVPKGATKKQLIKIILTNKRNPQLINNLSMLIFANTSSFDGGESVDDEFSGGKSVMYGVDGSESGDKGKVFQQIGDWFKKRREQKAQQGTTGGGVDGTKEKGAFFKKIGNFFKKNKSKIGDISSSLADGLGDRNNSVSTLNNSVNNANSKITTTAQPTKAMSQTTKALLIFGAIGLVAFIIYKRKK